MRRILLLTALIAAAPAAQADDFDFNPATLQADFRAIGADISAALNVKALSPAEAGGITGFEVGAIVNYTGVENEAAWRRVTGSDVDAVGMAGIAARKGLPFGIDVGGFYSTVPSTDAKLYGAELRYAILKGGVASPALALRAGYLKLSGVDDFDYDNKSLDVSVSKGFGPLTPYAGVGRVTGTLTPKGSFASTLREEEFEETRVFAGLRFGLGLFEITPEVEKIGDNTAYNLRLGLGL